MKYAFLLLQLISVSILCGQIGQIDSSFNQTGTLELQYQGFPTKGTSLHFLSNGNIKIVGETLFQGNAGIYTTLRHIKGNYASGYGNKGEKIIHFGGVNLHPYQSFQTPDKGLYICGSIDSNTTKDDFLILKIDSTGSLDTNFGNQGLLVFPLGPDFEHFYNMTLDDSARIVLCGDFYNGSHYESVIARFNPNGSLDSSFGNNGISTFNVDSANSGLFDLKIQPDGKIVSCGYATENSDRKFKILRLQENGLLDTTFGNKGFIFEKLGQNQDALLDIEILNDSSILALGYTYTSGITSEIVLAKYTPTGQIDSLFGQSGKVSLNPVAGNTNFGDDLILQWDGKILITGTVYPNNSGNFLLFRLTPDGQIDSAFGNDGKIFHSLGNYQHRGIASAVQWNGKILLLGTLRKSGFDHLVVTRFFGEPRLAVQNYPQTNGFQVYPNPSENQFYLRFETPPHQLNNVKLMDLSGKVLYKFIQTNPLKKEQKLSYPSTLPNGYYILSFTTEFGTSRIPILKQ